MLVDTDILIWYMRGNTRARTAIEKLAQPTVSLVTHMELVQGARNKEEQAAIRRFFDIRDFVTLPISDVISHRALFLMEEWCLSHGLLMADALIAATALEHGFTVLTGNVKHYQFLSNLCVSKFKP
ncbi:MAG: type II toxin-antitoxin system VapC family toxin [Pseudomonadota bacterium]|nr:type II toxin-antitoxin system VapC family toxin [Pseudomonadota bacterium]